MENEVDLAARLAELEERLARLETLVLPIGPGTVRLPLVNADGSLTAKGRLPWEETPGAAERG